MTGARGARPSTALGEAPEPDRGLCATSASGCRPTETRQALGGAPAPWTPPGPRMPLPRMPLPLITRLLLDGGVLSCAPTASTDAPPDLPSLS